MSAEEFARCVLRRRIASIQFSDERSADGHPLIERITLENGVAMEFRGEHGFASSAEVKLLAPTESVNGSRVQ